MRSFAPIPLSSIRLHLPAGRARHVAQNCNLLPRLRDGFAIRLGVQLSGGVSEKRQHCRMQFGGKAD